MAHPIDCVTVISVVKQCEFTGGCGIVFVNTVLGEGDIDSQNVSKVKLLMYLLTITKF